MVNQTMVNQTMVNQTMVNQTMVNQVNKWQQSYSSHVQGSLGELLPENLHCDFCGAKDDECEGDNWSCKTCKTAV